MSQPSSTDNINMDIIEHDDIIRINVTATNNTNISTSDQSITLIALIIEIETIDTNISCVQCGDVIATEQHYKLSECEHNLCLACVVQQIESYYLTMSNDKWPAECVYCVNDNCNDECIIDVGTVYRLQQALILDNHTANRFLKNN